MKGATPIERKRGASSGFPHEIEVHGQNCMNHARVVSRDHARYKSIAVDVASRVISDLDGVRIKIRYDPFSGIP